VRAFISPLLISSLYNDLLIPASATGTNIRPSVKSETEAAPTAKPCCVCKSEKQLRDECMLFSNSSDPAKDCASAIDKYKSCMAGFGFKLP
jgi:cytochrome c oxidase assembly protein subunit 17